MEAHEGLRGGQAPPQGRGTPRQWRPTKNYVGRKHRDDGGELHDSGGAKSNTSSSHNMTTFIMNYVVHGDNVNDYDAGEP